MLGAPPRFVVQRHSARSLHYDLRLERDGVLASWSVPKGLPLDPGSRRRAVHTEDHPLEYLGFEGEIPAGRYGAGTMEIYDTGTYELVEEKRDGGLTIRLAGSRLSGVWALGEPSLWSRRGHDLTQRFAGVARDLGRGLRVFDCVVDGEVCALDSAGRPSFSLLQQGKGRLVYVVFDLLELEGRELVRRPLSERRALLAEIVDPRPGVVRLSETFADGAGLLAAVREQGLEGVVAKRAASRYRPGDRTREWLKLKARLRAELRIAAYTLGEGRRERLGSLVLAEERDGELEYAGNVGAGFTEASIDELLAALAPLRREAPTLARVPDDPRLRGVRVVWVEPALSADVELSERTHDRRVRAPVFKGFSRPSSAGDRLLFREDGIRRRDLARYYRALAPVLLPHLRGRPFTIKRCYPLVQDEDALLWMLEYGCVDLHVWSSRCDRPERPDYVLFDLDPAGVGFADVVAAARLVREALEALELESCVRTSGGDGLHVLVPLARRHTHAEAREFAQVVAGALVRSFGGLVTAERSKERRRGVFLDTKMNGHGQQVVSSYSVRPLPGAPVATPLR